VRYYIKDRVTDRTTSLPPPLIIYTTATPLSAWGFCTARALLLSRVVRNSLDRPRLPLAAITVGLCILNSFDPYPITYSLSNP
jgi:hypothetical protein